MKISYKKLWKLLIDRNMTKTQLRIAAGISSSSLAKLGDKNPATHRSWDQFFFTCKIRKG